MQDRMQDAHARWSVNNVLSNVYGSWITSRFTEVGQQYCTLFLLLHQALASVCEKKVDSTILISLTLGRITRMHLNNHSG